MSLFPLGHQAVHPMMLLLAPGHIKTQHMGEVRLGMCCHSEPRGKIATINLWSLVVRAQEENKQFSSTENTFYYLHASPENAGLCH